MRPSALSLLVCFLLAACQSDERQKTVSTDPPENAQSKIWQLQTIDAKDYLTAIRPNTTASIEQICEESKGYRNNEWPGLNECDWASEQQLLKQDQALVKRKDQTLSLKLMNDDWIRLNHTPTVLYQYKGWLKNTDHFVVLINQSGHCNVCWLINRKDGSKQRIEGVPYFSEDGQQAIVTSKADNASNVCNSQLELWQFQDGQFKPISIHPTKNRVTQKLFWKAPKEVWLRQSSGATEQYQEHYAKMEW